MSTQQTELPAGLKDKHATMWATGDYPRLAELVTAVGERCAEVLAAQAGEDILDVATGTGTTALRIAESGADVTGLDLTPELIEAAKARSADVTWIVGDAEDLPFEDASFDGVTSSIGIQFAPRHQVVADELVRVLRPGGRLVLGNWTMDGMIGQLFKLTGSFVPPPPGVQPPGKWGDEEHVRELLAPHGLEPSFERRSVVMPFESGEAWIAYFEEMYGPTMAAKAATSAQGRWEELRSATAELAQGYLREGEGVVQDYYVISATKPAS